ncbi:MAG TPA: cyclic nucleotide-binding domain-containing protein, partial [Gallionellaceae bacterium]|nr:cyclic nucleotide-binding domain-containing protein [Gallionellaceae bacterium]
MLEQLNREVYAVGETIFRAGDEGDCAYIIEDGSVEVCVNTPDGEQVVKQIGRGELFGEIALIDHKPRTATVRAREKAVLIP